jgi:cellulose synthase/poly-beta-1,6-N-acetylglucosamine synthase-like glycosyltransferase
MKLLIAIPALNEEQSIRSTIERCLEARGAILQDSPVTDVEITVVSDGSTDHTVDRASEFGSLINLIAFTENQGYGAAIMGFEVTRTESLFFFPRALKALRFAEPFLSWTRLGAQYLILGAKR